MPCETFYSLPEFPISELLCMSIFPLNKNEYFNIWDFFTQFFYLIMSVNIYLILAIKIQYSKSSSQGILQDSIKFTAR